MCYAYISIIQGYFFAYFSDFRYSTFFNMYQLVSKFHVFPEYFIWLIMFQIVPIVPVMREVLLPNYRSETNIHENISGRLIINIEQNYFMVLFLI